MIAVADRSSGARWLGLVALGFAATAFGDGVSPEVQHWLGRMAEAPARYSFEGTFAYTRGERLSTLHIQHRLAGGAPEERLVSLDGAAREVHRDQRAVTCILPDANSVLVGRRGEGLALLDALSGDWGRLARHYRLETERGDDRVAGLQARVIAVRPQDGYRYGYRIWLTEQHALPVKAQVLGGDGRPLEQFAFTQIDVQAAPATEDAPTAHPASASAPSDPTGGLTILGFDLLHRLHSELPGQPAAVEHWVFGDGIATLSVYFESDPDGIDEMVAEDRGALHLFQVSQSGRRVTAIGEVPADTVRRVALQLLATGAGP